jgi:outer membrane protein assembly factor BamE (lipoprotein component of BamABCDE complex)
MTRRRLLLFALIAVAVVLAVGVWLLWPRTAITRENAAKIQAGMTLAEVEAILGGPARDEMTGRVLSD